MLKRKMYDKLMEWKNKKNHKALCILGARQVGKTTIIRQFAKENYESFVEINFIEEKKASEIFDDSFNANTIITNLTAYTKKSLTPGKTLIFLDEIQKCPQIRTAIKFLVEDGRFDYIESGSLLGVNFREIPSYPVGFEEIHHMYPMDFEEFLWANGVSNETIQYLHEAYKTLTPITNPIHETLNKLFYTYIVVGGMPDVVNTYIQTHDIGKVIAYQKSILDQYRLDITQYASNNDKMKIKAIFDAIPSQLNESNRRFFVNSLSPSARMNRYEDCFNWLSDAGVALPCFNVNLPQIPLEINKKHNLFKLFMNDVGLLCAACMDNIQFDLLKGNLDINLGSILENVMAQQIISNGFDLYFYDSKGFGELDFVVQNGMNIDLIEVKSGNNYKSHATLNKMMSVKNWNFNHCYVFCKDNIQVCGKIKYIPWYMIMFFKPITVPIGTIHEIDLSHLI